MSINGKVRTQIHIQSDGWDSFRAVDKPILLVWEEFCDEVFHRDHGLLLVNDSGTPQTVDALLSSLHTHTHFYDEHI